MAVLDDERLYKGLSGDKERKARRALLERLSNAGVPHDELVKAVEQDRLALLPAQLVIGGRTPYTLSQVAKKGRVDSGYLRQLLLAIGRANPVRGEKSFTEADVEQAKIIRRLLDGGLPRKGLLQVSRVLGLGMSSLAVAVSDLVLEALVDENASEDELAEQYSEAAQQLGPLLGPLLAQELLVHIREELSREALGRAEKRAGGTFGNETVAIAFADLVDFTKLGGQLPPERLGEMANLLADQATEVLSPPVQLVKTIGDAVMLASSDAKELVWTLHKLVKAIDKKGKDFPELRAGVAYGTAVTRGGDWFGTPVNVASRLTENAKPGTIDVSEEAKEAAGNRFDWSRKKRRLLKGVGRASYYRLKV